jgi:hypothetical protein
MRALHLEWISLTLLVLFVSPAITIGETFDDDFSQGLRPLYWRIVINQPLFSVDDTQGDVRIGKPAGGDYTLQQAVIRFRGQVPGDFDVSVDYRDAYIDQVDGLPGNQVQLNTYFGGQAFAIVRSDEPGGGGHNHHVWIAPPGTWVGAQPDDSTAGTMRIRRVGTLVEAYIHDTLFYSGYFNAEDLNGLSFCLQNNCTVDSTSVTFDDFHLTADAITAATSPLYGDRIALASPWPNPASSATSLTFKLPAAAPVTLAVFDVRGCLVQTLVHQHQTAGPHVVRWNGCDDHGRQAPAGIYLVRLVVGDFVTSKRLLLMR